jgi:dihydrofolate reductase
MTTQQSNRRGTNEALRLLRSEVDGFLARPDDALDFLHTGEQEPHGFKEFLASVDLVVIGRRTFEVVRKLGHLALYGRKHMVVLSGRPLDLASACGLGIEQLSAEPGEIATRLEARGFQHAYIDGGLTIQRFLRAGLIDRLVITRVPVLIGEGIPLFGPVPGDIPLHHVATQCCSGGLVQTEYQVASYTEAPG